MKITYNFRKPIDEFEICFRIVEATEGGGGGGGLNTFTGTKTSTRILLLYE